MTPRVKPPHTGRFLLLLLTLSLLAFVVSTLTTTRILRRISVVEVPDLIDRSVEEARSLLRTRRLSMDIMEFRFDSHLAANQIVTQDPAAGSSVKSGRIVRVVVSRGSQTLKLPEITGLTLREAGVLLSKKGLSLGRTTRLYSREAPKNVILDQSPAAGEYSSQNARVNILVSAGPRPVSWIMPALRGAGFEDASRALKFIGLELEDIRQQVDDAQEPNTVIAQKPAPGQTVAAGEPAALVISRRASDRKLPTRLVNVPFTVPAGEAAVRIKMVVTDEAGRHEIHNAMERPAADLLVRTTVLGDRASVKIFMNGTLREERNL